MERTAHRVRLSVVVWLAGCMLAGCEAGQSLYDPPEAPSDSTKVPTDTTPGPPQANLASVINEYRVAMGLSAIPLSKSLTMVAEAHVQDLQQNDPTGGVCNGHSWSDKGNWTPCCYTADHAQAKCMWDKPKEMTNGVYTSEGFEIAAGSSGYWGMTPEGALTLWKSSQPHHDVILNRGIWASYEWKAMGAAYSDSWAVVWFGRLADPLGPPT